MSLSSGIGLQSRAQYDTAPVPVCITNLGVSSLFFTYERVTVNEVTATEISRVRHWSDGTTDVIVAPTGTSVAGTCSGSSTDRELLIGQCTAIAISAGVAIGDVIQVIKVMDVSGAAASLVETIGFNVTTQAVLTAANVPPAANLSCASSVVDRELIPQNCTATAAVGATVAIGDIIQIVREYDVTVAPPTLLSTFALNVTKQTALAAVPAVAGLSCSSTDTDREILVQNCTLAAAVVGGTIGDVVQIVRNYDVTTTPPTVLSTIAFNVTTQLALAAVPAAASLSCSAVDRETRTWQCTTFNAGVGYVSADVIQFVQFYNVAVNPAVLLETKVFNLTQQTTLVAAPLTADMNCQGQYYTKAPIYFVCTAKVALAGSYSIGDRLARVTVMNIHQDSIAFNEWVNLTTGFILAAAPAAANMNCPGDIKSTVPNGPVRLTAGASQVIPATATGFTVSVVTASAANLVTVTNAGGGVAGSIQSNGVSFTWNQDNLAQTVAGATVTAAGTAEAYVHWTT